MLTDDQLQSIKMHLLKQLDNFPEDQRKIVKHKILSMNSSEMEDFLKENGLDYKKESEQPEQQCIFCAITKDKIKSYKIEENEEYSAILELNPLSRGNVLIMPKKHVSLEKLHENSVGFAKKIATLLLEKLNPNDIQFQKNEVLGHATLEVIPVYGETKLEKQRASEEDLEKLKEELTSKVKEKKVEEKTVEDKVDSPKKTEELPKIEIKEETKPVEKRLELPKIKPRIGWL